MASSINLTLGAHRPCDHGAQRPRASKVVAQERLREAQPVAEVRNIPARAACTARQLRLTPLFTRARMPESGGRYLAPPVKIIRGYLSGATCARP
jgi:hypothetical protein